VKLVVLISVAVVVAVGTTVPALATVAAPALLLLDIKKSPKGDFLFIMLQI